MSLWEKFQKDFRKNLKEGLVVMRERGIEVSKKLEELTEEGKRKYSIFTLNMKVQEEFAKLGGQVYDLAFKKPERLLENNKIKSRITRIQKLEGQIHKLEKMKMKRTSSHSPKKKTSKKTRKLK